ncbi:MAG: hypothetical protein KIS73_06480 [Enhydrobacter sp.]|nr:hypothetical protein [Enhydrobacter sp.]
MLRFGDTIQGRLRLVLLAERHRFDPSDVAAAISRFRIAGDGNEHILLELGRCSACADELGIGKGRSGGGKQGGGDQQRVALHAKLNAGQRAVATSYSERVSGKPT